MLFFRKIKILTINSIDWIKVLNQLIFFYQVTFPFTGLPLQRAANAALHGLRFGDAPPYLITTKRNISTCYTFVKGVTNMLQIFSILYLLDLLINDSPVNTIPF